MDTLLATVAVALVYLTALRLIDMNEKEPLWALALLFAAGGIAGAVLTFVVTAETLALEPLRSAVTEEFARSLAIFAGMFGLTAIGSRRGVSEINGVMDGVVYGGAGGLGLAVGRMLTSTAAAGVDVASAVEAPLVGVARFALTGLADGVFGALIGAGLAALLMRGGDKLRALYPIAGWLAAVATHLAYNWAGEANALKGEAGLAWAWASLLAPILLVAVVSVAALRREGRAIADLGEEACVTPRDLELLRNPWQGQEGQEG